MNENEDELKQEDTEESIETSESTEIELLRQVAATMGLKHHPAMGVTKLKALIEEAKEAKEGVDEKVATKPATGKKVTAGKATRRKEALKLIRIRISDMNPINANLKGALFSVGNSELGFIKKMVPFNAEEGFHVPSILVEQIRNKKFVSHFEVKINGKMVNRHKLIPQYAIEIMPPLTPKELQELKQRQIIASGA